MVCYHWCSLSKSYILLMLFLCIQYAELQTPDPCDTTEALNDMNKRHPTYQMDATPLCDYDLVKKWYSVGSKVMPTTAPDLLSCGTLYPYWIKDPLPTVTNTIAEVTACKVEFGDTCAKDHKIRVKKCNDFLVFELIPTTGCSSAYCFERADGCIPQTVTDVSVSYQNVMWDSSLPNNRGIVRHSPYFNLICNFAPLPTPNLNYKITWYIDKKEIQTQVVTSSTRNKATFSAKEMANHIETLNVWVHCTVEVMGSTTGTSCPSKESPLFFVGVKILSELPIVMNRGGRAFIKLQPTVPFVTDTLMLGNIVLDATPVELDLFAKTTQCNGALVNGFSCSKKIKGFPYPDRVQYDTPTNWNQVINYEIVNENTAAFDIPHLITLQLTSTSGSGVVGHMFGKLPFPDLPIQMVEDKNSWKGKSCTALTDPHMRTFDNLGYECQLDGKFILYRNTESNQEVHVKHRLCHRWYSVPRCICAVAVRAGRQIFTIDICQGNRYINFPLCEDEVMKVVREQDKLYKIYLPSGTTVQISIREWPWGTGTLHLDVTIYPSAADEGKSEGLCGSLDNSYHNDLTRRNHAQPDPIVTYPDGFSRSWVVEANEDLFDKDINEYGFINSMSITNRLLCECNPTSKTALCTYTAGKTCYYERGRKLQCFIFGENKFDKRRKRSIYELDKTEQKKKQHKAR
ncbi:von Willebrand factor D and EGF domain-containing protein-like [Saccostrea cucullata]|uniref:von Willebrand factor D and EGF domain-containing protein-like n=1 Tax=Saccostrea cuccullata TaxID=36930 RepID=UPI002ED215EB